MRTKPIALWSAMAMLVFMGVCGTAHPMPAAALDSPASLTIEVYTCDSLNDPIEPNQTLIDECNLGTDDISFT
ncbi:MAG: hypothetical protein KC438_10985, partial [Thermomicrobiales bacterium]|nr:hypothetical protein [Thermomicrobiales bacterium]